MRPQSLPIFSFEALLFGLMIFEDANLARLVVCIVNHVQRTSGRCYWLAGRTGDGGKVLLGGQSAVNELLVAIVRKDSGIVS